MKGEKIKISCKVCGQFFEDYVSNKRSNFCSLPCYWKSKKGSKGYWLGKKRSVETIEKIRQKKIGQVGYWRGKTRVPFTKEALEKLSKNNIGKHPKTANFMQGETHTNWKGGIAKDRHKVGTIEYKKWVSGVFARDKWTCQACGVRGVYLQAHHIKSWARYPDLRFSLDNGITLCVPCHKLTDNFAGKKQKNENLWYILL